MKIYYDELLFPQVEELPRDWPVIIPLGTGPLPEDLQGSHQIIMPAIPFGFAAPLEVPSFARLLDSLKDILREDGFKDIHVIECAAPVNLHPDKVALLVTGHTEQHGFHLPLSTDTVIASALAEALVERGADICRLPVWPYGVSSHRKQYPGTLTIDPRVWEDFWVDVIGRLREEGFRRFYLLNGHGGNHSYLVNVVKFAGDRWPDIFAATSFLHTSSGEAARLLEAERRSSLMGHACELETSYMLCLRPDLVRMDLAVDEIEFVATPRYQVDWISDGVMAANPCWSDDTRTGSYGAPTVSSAANGKRWMEAAVAELALHIEEVEAQQRMRLKRRSEGWVEGAWRECWHGPRLNLPEDC